ncbi:hypothetical protein GCM10022405_10200 [Gibbsiella dentisursi]|uniref:Uncharacterized protein n=1 Tax=Gibbsiella dentisursi TaxID=796890 RepID=A0ABP7KT43_9GAMM
MFALTDVQLNGLANSKNTRINTINRDVDRLTIVCRRGNMSNADQRRSGRKIDDFSFRRGQYCTHRGLGR